MLNQKKIWYAYYILRLFSDLYLELSKILHTNYPNKQTFQTVYIYVTPSLFLNQEEPYEKNKWLKSSIVFYLSNDLAANLHIPPGNVATWPVLATPFTSHLAELRRRLGVLEVEGKQGDRLACCVT